MKDAIHYFTPHQLALQGLAIAAILFIIFKWEFVKDMLSEDKVPSSKRAIAFLCAVTICTCEIYHTLKGEELEYNHLIAFLCAILLLLGIATVPQILELWKGKQPSKDEETKP